ncbi:hypothetical protein Vafri_4762 [Volvox africanus]|uniref:Uncharacterized protein n=1 Tax=Volvox africanus TaxID=51714 RepID=A0A8J4AUS7_9CHLO|nr:hypothetical protein Vafri_4762 [Volvox africanus]
MSFKLLLSFLFWCGMVELALGMQNPTHPGPFLSPQQQHARALQQLEQQQQLQYQQLQQQQAAVAAQRLATQSASSGHPIADLRSAQLPSGGTDVAAQLAAQMERLTNMMEARLGALESRFAAQVPAGSAAGVSGDIRRITHNSCSTILYCLQWARDLVQARVNCIGEFTVRGRDGLVALHHRYFAPAERILADSVTKEFDSEFARTKAKVNCKYLAEKEVRGREFSSQFKKGRGGRGIGGRGGGGRGFIPGRFATAAAGASSATPGGSSGQGS